MSLTTQTRTPAWKIALIPVLAFVLWGVLKNNSETDPTETTATQPAANTPAANTPVTTAPNGQTAPRLEPLAPASLDDVLRINPFQSIAALKPAPPPESPVSEEPTTTAQTPTEESPARPPVETPKPKPVLSAKQRSEVLKQITVTAVFPDDRGGSALIGDRTVRVGEELSPGVRVAEIRGTEVILRVEQGEQMPSLAK